jgi:transcriptional regulator with XRE-family HTH domain
MNIGSRIKKIREIFNLSQTDFASGLGVSQAHISKIERGFENPSAQLLFAISWRYGIREEWIVNGEGDMLLDVEEYFQHILKLYPLEKIKTGLMRLGLMNGITMLQREKESFDGEFLEIIEYLKELWKTGDRDLQGWLKIQFKNAFPKFEEAQKKRTTTQGTPNGA